MKKLLTALLLLIATAAFVLFATACGKGTEPSDPGSGENGDIPKPHTHTPGEAVTENYVDSDCEKTGSYDEVIYCTECDTELSRTEKVVERHKFVDGFCSVCGAEHASEGLVFTLNEDKTSYSVTGIGTCKDTEIIIPSKYNELFVTSIGSNAFHKCTSLTSVVIGDSVTSIGYSAFSGCSRLTSVSIGDSVTSIGSDAFSGCSSLNAVYISDIAAWCNISFGYNIIFGYYDANPLYYVDNLYLNGELLTELIIPEGVTSIGDWAFAFCSSLTSVKYRGTEAQWNAITKGPNWKYNTGNYTITYNYDGD